MEAAILKQIFRLRLKTELGVNLMAVHLSIQDDLLGLRLLDRELSLPIGLLLLDAALRLPRGIGGLIKVKPFLS